ncbi:gamma-glutamylcyclotransferase [Mangrovibrevibacter kandeliae]|uniref:gamma-glutamylcyclotransferase n=1 Tax=Mangrovibrevibacter kandeliae TaxID=2968473 RepID=UPI0021190703|nr:gamma-glutamylcyclotransferase [Aurantimonas sp. CSK15Z-1]MCQ8783840.1 gamma-glutamylcyclotransferase [Aurantimonas sp. CSK15Z-1]
MNEFWVFGYGSLIWRPDFDYEERVKARLGGYHRALCVHSFVHRGTPERPGLVFGLDRGGSCVGMAFRVASDKRRGVTEYLRSRELVTNVYRETTLPVRLADGRAARALTFIVDRGHPQYAGRVSVETAATIVTRAHGRSGANREYVTNALAEIHGLGLKDAWLEQVVDRLAPVGSSHAGSALRSG